MGRSKPRCHWRCGLGLMALVVVAAACGPAEERTDGSDGEGPAAVEDAGPFSATATFDERLRAVPSKASSGERVELRFDEDMDRGVGWVLERQTADGWSFAFTLVAASDQYGGEAPRWSAETIDIDDASISGLGPDVVVLPPDLEPGPWRICHMGNEGDVFCTEITITE